MKASDASAGTRGPVSPDWLPLEGEMAQLFRTTDWSKTSVGPIDSWPQSLKIVVRIMLTSRYAMWMGWGPDLAFFYNDAYRPTLGVKHPKALGRPAREVWAEIWSDVSPRIEAVLSTGRATWDEALLLFLERSGYPEETYHTFSYSPLFDEAGSTVGMLCVVTEETERVIGERRLALLREVASALATTNQQDEIFTALTRCVEGDPRDLPFTLTYCFEADGKTASLASSTGIPPGHPAAPEHLLVEDGAPVWPLDEILRGAPSVRVSDLEDRFGALPAGPWPAAPSEAVLVPLSQQGQERPAGVLIAGLNPFRGFDSDYSGFLDVLVGQISAGLANARAYEDERRRAEALAELDRAKTLFFSNVSHEFRTPLTLILGPLEDALQQPTNGEDRARLELMHRSALRLQRLVNALLDFSRVEAGRVQASYLPCDLPQLTADLASMFRAAVERAGLQLHVDCGESLPEPAYVDREMWEKIVLNLLSNALKYTFDGEIRVSMGAKDGHAELRVGDTGTGIAESELPRLFERFHRIENARGRTNEGSGIGLALVQELVKLHGGTIEVSSAPGRGTTFFIRLPLGSRHLPQERVGAGAGLSSTATSASAYVEEALRWLPAGEPVAPAFQLPDGQVEKRGSDAPRPRIVLADDNTDMREYVGGLLGSQYEVEAVQDGLAAVKAVRRRKPDLVLTDVMMPGLDGFGVVRELRSDPETTALPIILLSARAGEESRIEGLERGADDYLVKPFSARELLARVSAHLELARVRQEAGAALRESEARFRLMADNAPVMIWVTESDGRCTFLSKSWYEFTGQGPAEGFGLGWVQAIHPDDREQAGGKFLEANEQRSPFQVEYRLRRQDGEYCWALDAAAPRIGADGVFQGYIGSVIDITERKRAEEADRLETLRLQKLSQTALTINSCHSIESVAEVITQEASSIIGAQQAVTRLNVDQEWAQELNPSTIPSEYVANPDYPAHPMGAEVMPQALQTGVPGQPGGLGDPREVSPPGRLAAPLVGRDGRHLGVIQIVDRRDGEFTEADQAILVQLAQMGAIAIENARLYEGLRQQDRRKDEFLAMLAHELRNPLAPIRNAVHILKEPLAGPSQRERVRALIERQVNTLARLVDDLMDVSRVTRGKIRLERSPTLLSDVVHQAVETTQPLIDSQGHRLEVQLPDEPLVVDGDLTRLGQVLGNLLSNAAKYTPPGGLLQVEVRREHDLGIIRVRDNGAGIGADMLPHIFDLFTQAERSLDRSQGGLGIGLALTRKLVELHGGEVTAASAGEGKGSEFCVTLPLLLPEQMAAATDATADPSRDAVRRVLIVEDNRDSADMLAMVLELAGHQVEAAHDGPTGLSLASRLQPDVVLLDIGLPGMSGYDVAREIRRDSKLARVLLVAMTGYGQSGDKQRAVETGFDQHLTKPVDPETLLKIVLERPGTGALLRGEGRA